MGHNTESQFGRFVEAVGEALSALTEGNITSIEDLPDCVDYRGQFDAGSSPRAVAKLAVREAGGF